MNPQERALKVMNFLLEGKDGKVLKLLKEEIDFTTEIRGDNPIHLAARSGKLDIIKAMKEIGADLRQENVNGNTAMHYAARDGRLEVIEFLIENGVDVNHANEEGQSPLHMAVHEQTMDIIEFLVDLGMNPNAPSKQGNTPLHEALINGRQEAMEGLLIKGADPNIINKDGQLPEDVANLKKNPLIKQSLQMYSALLIAMKRGSVKAKGFKIVRKQVEKALQVDRVGVIIAKIDIPSQFPTGFYCRREKVENATVALRDFEDEHIFSDVFYIKIFDVNRNCKAKINLPLYKAPSDKEEMVVRFVNSSFEDRPVDVHVTENEVVYCPLDVTLVPETNCICVVYIRQRREEKKVSKKGTKVTSKMEKDFSLDIPGGTFDEETVLCLQVFETQSNKETDMDQELDDLTTDVMSTGQAGYTNPTEPDTLGNVPTPTDIDILGKGPTPTDIDILEKGPTPTDTDATEDSEIPNTNLITDVYQITVAGKQPKKSIQVQIPLCKGMEADDEIAIVRADETRLNDTNALEVLPVQPKVINCNLVFEVSHFSVYTATWKRKVATDEDRQDLQTQIFNAREKRKPASFFAVVKKDETDTKGRKQILVVECGMATKSRDRRRNWIVKSDFEEQNPPETGAILMTPGDTFYVNVTGNAKMEEKKDSTRRKIQFSQCRASFQAYRLKINNMKCDPEKSFAYVIITKKTDNGDEEVTRLRIKLNIVQQIVQTQKTERSIKPRMRKKDKETLKDVLS